MKTMINKGRGKNGEGKGGNKGIAKEGSEEIWAEGRNTGRKCARNRRLRKRRKKCEEGKQDTNLEWRSEEKRERREWRSRCNVGR